ncbi:hypothetical protein gpAD87_21890 [Paenibacillus sp. AD87]|nr:hypothetical protein gpAD87_21890 [Paenibacillus sp. AD87]
MEFNNGWCFLDDTLYGSLKLMSVDIKSNYSSYRNIHMEKLSSPAVQMQ